MKKRFFTGIFLIGCMAFFAGCLKNTPYVTTINPSLTANIGTYDFTAATVVPSILDTQVHDTSTTLIITAYTSDNTSIHDKIVLTIFNYKDAVKLYSVVRQECSAYYLHGGVMSVAASGLGSAGVISVTHVTSNSLIGYFTFTTTDGIVVSNGTFNVGKP